MHPLNQANVKMCKNRVVCTPLTDYQVTTFKSYNLLHFAVFCDFHYITTVGVKLKYYSKNLAKQGISRQFKEEKYNDKSTIHLPRQHFKKTRNTAPALGLEATGYYISHFISQMVCINHIKSKSVSHGHTLFLTQIWFSSTRVV